MKRDCHESIISYLDIILNTSGNPGTHCTLKSNKGMEHICDCTVQRLEGTDRCSLTLTIEGAQAERSCPAEAIRKSTPSENLTEF